MRRVLVTVAGVVLLAQSLAPAQTIVSGLAIPVPAGDLAAAAGLDRTDPSTLGLDLVRILFASARAPETIRPRAAVTRLLDSGSAGADRIPLPLTPAIWRERLLGEKVADG